MKTAEEIIRESLRLHFLQGNSQIYNVDEWLDEQVDDTLREFGKAYAEQAIRKAIKAKQPMMNLDNNLVEVVSVKFLEQVIKEL